MDFYLQYQQRHLDEVKSHLEEVGSDHSYQGKNSIMNQCRTLFRRARQIGIDRAWREYVQTTQGRDWSWVKLFEVFNEWMREAGHGKEESLNKPHWNSAIYEEYRKGCHFLETHPELLDPNFFEAPLTAEITDLEKYMSSYEEHFKNKEFLASQPEIIPYGPPSQYWSAKERLFGLIEGQNLLRDMYRRGGTSQAIRDAYVNAYGGFVLNLPLWLEEVFKQLGPLYQSEKRYQTAPARASLLRDAILRAYSDPEMNLVPEIEYALMKAFCSVLGEERYREDVHEQELRIDAYEMSFMVYTRERYPYQWALIQQELGDIYRYRSEGNYPDDIEKAIQCYEEALQIITRNVACKVCDLTNNNRNWAVMQYFLGKAYARRLSLNKSLDQKIDLTCAAKCYRTALSLYTPEISISAHRDILINLALLESRHGVAEFHGQGDTTALLEIYKRADEAFMAARQANMEISWREYYLQNRVQQLVTWHGVQTMYASHAWCLWKLGKVRDAVIALEEGRAHALAQALAITHTESKGLCNFHAQKLEEVRYNWETQLEKGNPADIRKAREDLLDLRDAIRDHCQKYFLPRESSYQNIIESPALHQALVYITAAEQGGLAFVIPPAQEHTKPENRDPIAIALPKLTEQRVNDWFIRTDKDRRIIGGYQYAVQSRGVEQLLQQWVLYSTSVEQERERLLTIPLRDLPGAISSPFITLQVALKNTIEAWQAQADDLSKQFIPASQNNAHALYELLASSLQEGFEKNIFSADSLFNWYLLEAELELLQQELSDTFIFDLRQELDHLGLRNPDQPIAFIPCGKLGMLPLHAAWARRSRWKGVPIPLAETCELTYQASARSLAIAREAIEAIKNLPEQGPIIAYGNPLPTTEKPLEWATAEAKALARLALDYDREGSKAIVEEEAARAEIMGRLLKLQEEGKLGAWIHIASHGHADPTNPKNCYMLLCHNETLALADLQQRQLLRGVRGFIASGCTTALGDLERAPDELISLAAGALQAGAPCAIATFWTVRDAAQFLLMQRFMRELLQNPSSTPARALREATRWLRKLTHKQLTDLAKKGLQGIRSVPEDLTSIPDVLRGVIDTAEELTFISNDTSRLSVEDAFSGLPSISSFPYYTHTVHPFGHASCWASAVMYGA